VSDKPEGFTEQKKQGCRNTVEARFGSDSCKECASLGSGKAPARAEPTARGEGTSPILRHARSQAIQFERQAFRHLTADARAYIISTLSKNVTSSRGRLNNTVGRA
jgi:hypothetical protein